MTTQTFDDGSTFSYNADYSFVTSTDAPGAYPTNVGGAYSPARVNPNAGSWDDVFKFGLSRYIDARFAQPVLPANASPVYVRERPNSLVPLMGGQPASLNSMLPWLLIAGVAFLALKS